MSIFSQKAKVAPFHFAFFVERAGMPVADECVLDVPAPHAYQCVGTDFHDSPYLTDGGLTWCRAQIQEKVGGKVVIFGFHYLKPSETTGNTMWRNVTT